VTFEFLPSLIKFSPSIVRQVFVAETGSAPSLRKSPRKRFPTKGLWVGHQRSLSYSGDVVGRVAGTGKQLVTFEQVKPLLVLRSTRFRRRVGLVPTLPKTANESIG
jgi:hypothetical protein